MPVPSRTTDQVRDAVSRCLDETRRRHRRGDDAFAVCQGLSEGIDAILADVFNDVLGEDRRHVALIGVGGYGRREQCPYSDIDLLFLRQPHAAEERIRRLVTFLWDSGFDLGHSVRTLAESYRFMKEDVITAATLLDNRLIAGSKRLHARFQSGVIDRYRRRLRKVFVRLKTEQLRASIRSPGATIYVLEPHLKDGLCGLRDIQRFLWIENMRRRQGTFEAFRRGGPFAPERITALEDAYRFFLRVRIENHFLHGMRHDILEADSALDVAHGLGYESSARDAASALMADYYQHARSTNRFLRFYLETSAGGRGFLRHISRQIVATQVNRYLLLYEGRLFLKNEPETDDLAEEIIGIFVEAHRRDVQISEALREWIRLKLKDETLDFAGSASIRTAFLGILRDGRNAGLVLKIMHKTGVLARIIPEFAQVDGLVSPGGYHHYTVDEHTLRTLEKLDAIERLSDDRFSNANAGSVVGDRERSDDFHFHSILAQIDGLLPLRIALLLHDVGKGASGDHSITGSQTAGLVCERLGLKEETIDTVRFLVYRHLWMFRVSQRQDYSEVDVVRSFANVVGTQQRLRMLYLLTYIDISSVGPHVWTAWKGAQLAEVYGRTHEFLQTGVLPEFDLDEVLAGTDLDEEDRERVRWHCAQVDSASYVREFVPERILEHAKLVARYRETGKSQVGVESFAGYHDITCCCSDRQRLFADLTGVLLSEGFYVLGARILSCKDGVALDVFQVTVADDVNIPVERRVERTRKKLRQVESRVVVVDDLIRRWLRDNRHRSIGKTPRALYGPKAIVRNDLSAESTVVEVNAGHRPGLLHDEASALSRLGLDVRSARISTVGTRARDVFFVVEADGQKVTNPARMTLIERELEARTESPGPALLQGGPF